MHDSVWRECLSQIRPLPCKAGVASSAAKRRESLERVRDGARGDAKEEVEPEEGMARQIIYLKG